MKQTSELTEKQFHEEIRSRLEDSAWDMKISQKVMSARRSSSRRVIMSSLSLAGVAAAIFIAVMFVNNWAEGDVKYNRFITRQVEETFKAGGLSDTGVDDMIEETLALR